MEIVTSTKDLPVPEPMSEFRDPRATWQFRYLRSASDLSILIDCATGDCFQSADGSPWPDHGYHVDRNSNNNAVTVVPASAFCGGDAKPARRRAA